MKETGQIVRNDDNLEVLARRFETFEIETRPVLDYFDERNQLLKINGDQSAEAVTSDAI